MEEEKSFLGLFFLYTTRHLPGMIILQGGERQHGKIVSAVHEGYTVAVNV